LALSEYAKRWEVAFREVADTFLRKEAELKNVDRAWLHRNLEGPVLDIACGNAIDYPAFKDRGYMGVDVTESFIEAAVKLGVPRGNLTLSDARRMPFRDKQFKSAYMKDLLIHYPQREAYAFIDEMIRVSENAYVSWGNAYDTKRGKMLFFTPSTKPETYILNEGGQTFYYCAYDVVELEKRYKLTSIGEGTTISKVELR
jgi:ubiquinone/menaquinone biosynthesis C-methylase UbiE